MQISSTDEIKIWICRHDRISSPEDFARCRDLLSEEERCREEGFRLPSDRHAYVVTRAMQRLLLSRYTATDPYSLLFDKGAFGRPSLRQTPAESTGVDFNLSHDGNVIALGIVNRGTIGIDVTASACRPSFLGVARRFFTCSEVAALEALPADARADSFLQLWALKEAYVKALGGGLSIPFDTFGFSLEKPASIGFRANGNNEGAAPWSFWLLRPAAGVIAAICARVADEAIPTIGVYEFRPFAEDAPMTCQPIRTSFPPSIKTDEGTRQDRSLAECVP
jgi:4'-phosphopantetheinyl transferase